MNAEKSFSTRVHTQQLIDRLLQERGYYSPIELLLHEGRLMDDDFNAWSRGELADPSEVLMGDLEAIQAQLQMGTEYARQLDLAPESTDTGSSLQASRSTGEGGPLSFDQLLHTRYVPSRTRPQLDLFMDTPASVLNNKIRKALSAHHVDKAEALVEQLYDIDPGNDDLGGFDSLLEVLTQSVTPVLNASEQLQQLEQDITPLAASVLGKYSGDFISPLWLRLSEALAGYPFNPDQAKLHRSYTDARAKDWKNLQQAIEKEHKWQSHCELLLRHLQAAAMQGKEQSVIEDYLLLCWDFADHAEQIPTGQVVSVLTTAITEFQSLDAELETELFPAWLLLRFPGLTQRLTIDMNLSEEMEGNAWRVMHKLQSIPGNNLRVDLRAELKRISPVLFELFMQQL